MRRREFLQTTGVAMLAAPALTPLGCATDGGAGRTEVRSSELDELTLGDLRAGQESGRFTALSLTRTYLERIAAIDQNGPKVNAVIELNPDAGAIANERDRERKEGRVRGPLHGIPILLKDNLDTADRMQTTAGSLALEGHHAQRDSFVAVKLRAAGAVILGKTNLSEWANFRSGRSTSGWSSRGGQTRNPYVLNRNPGGSSSGSAAAVAANLCSVAIGTETDGSIMVPCSYCGIVGLKPTVGLVSRTGIIPIAHSMDTAGPMARTVADAAIVLNAITGYDARDSATLAAGQRTPLDYTASLNQRGLRDARIGVARILYQHCGDLRDLMAPVLEALVAAGAKLVLVDEPLCEEDFTRVQFDVMLYEFRDGLNRYLGGLAPDQAVHSLAELIDYNEQHQERTMPFFKQDLLQLAEARSAVSYEDYLKSVETLHALTREQGIDRCLTKHGVEAFVAPVKGAAHLTDHVHGDNWGCGWRPPAAAAGYPSITVPAGFVDGLPVGISFFGRAWSEPTLIRLAYAFEQATKHRRPPKFLPTLEV